MPNRLTKWFASSPHEGERDNLLIKSLDVMPVCLALAILSLGLFISGGCGSPSQQLYTAQTLTQMNNPNPNQELQQQLMLQSSKASFGDYKDYQVGPEDQLDIVIFGQDALNRKLRVNGEGEIGLPLVGAVKVAGLTPQQIAGKLQKLYDANYLVNPQITVTVKEYRHQQVAVTGAVGKPGSYELIGPRSLLEVLALAGGFSSLSGGPAGDILYVIRHQNAADLSKAKKAGTATGEPDKTETIVIDLRRLVSGQDPQLNIMVRSGDVVHVPFAGTAYVLGGVRKPGSIAVKERLTVSQAVAMVGGIDPILGTNNISIMRLDNQGKPTTIDTNLNSIIAQKDPDYPIKNNDVVVVYESAVKKTLFIIRTLLPIPTPSTSF
jgi:polysaccharide export outer membrane protein